MQIASYNMQLSSYEHQQLEASIYKHVWWWTINMQISSYNMQIASYNMQMSSYNM